MKKVILSIFILCIFVLSAVLLFLFFQPKDKDSNSGIIEAMPNDEIVLHVQESQAVVVGQSRQLFVTFYPSEAFVTAIIADEELIAVDENFLLTGLKVGSTTCQIKAELDGKIVEKNVSVTVEERRVTYKQNTFYSCKKQDGNFDYNTLEVFSNFSLEEKEYSMSENVVVISSSVKKTSTLPDFEFWAIINFYVKQGDGFSFELNEFNFEISCIQRVSLDLEFEESAYNKQNKTLTLYNNILSKAQAEQDGYFKQAMIKNDVSNLNINIEDQEILEAQGKTLFAKQVGKTNVEITSKTDDSFYLKINVEVVNIPVQTFHIFANNAELFDDEINIELGESVEVQIKNVVPEYVDIDCLTKFEFCNIEGDLIEFVEQSKTIFANCYGQALLKVFVCGQMFEISIFCRQAQGDGPIIDKNVKLILKQNGNQIAQIDENGSATLQLENITQGLIYVNLLIDGVESFNEKTTLLNAKEFVDYKLDYYYLDNNFLYFSITQTTTLEFKFGDISYNVEFCV